ncbi:MAG TPA: hypothetical protein VII72_17225 [Myxococcota bacterium]
MRRYRLVLARPLARSIGRRDLSGLAERVERRAPDVEVAVVGKHRTEQWHLLPHAFRPTLTIGFGALSRSRFLSGRILHTPWIPKHVELERLRWVGIPVPDWTVIEPCTRLDPGVWGPYVVVKPTRGGQGFDVRIRKTGRVRWEAPENFPPRHMIHKGPLLAQRFVYTGPWAVSYRVCTFLGRALYAWRVEQSHQKRRLESRWQFAGSKTGGGIQIIAPSMTSTYALTDDEELIALAERAHRLAFPDYPYLGIDLLRDAETGEVFVVEANSGGTVWHLSSKTGRSMQKAHGIDLYRQFGALDRAAEGLIEATRRHAMVSPVGRPQVPFSES